MRPPYVWMLFPLLAACGGNAPTWQKSGATENAVNEDLQQCRVQARMSPETSIIAAPTPTISGTPMLDRSQERDAKEDRQVSACMQTKGYSLKR